MSIDESNTYGMSPKPISVTSNRLTPADLDALEAALAKATPGEWGTSTAGYLVCTDTEFADFCGTNWEANSDLCALAHNALPALIAAARATVPEVIGAKHRDGQPWQVWEPFYGRWVYAKWQPNSETWRRTDGAAVIGIPTHALPMPPAPEGSDG